MTDNGRKNSSRSKGSGARSSRRSSGSSKTDARENPDAPLSAEERSQKQQVASLAPRTVYAVIRSRGEEELARPAESLWWSGVAAGLGISTSVLAQGILHAELADHPYRGLLSALGYPLGFVLVILSRLQLFTENTLTAILPLLANPSLLKLYETARLWGIVFAANLAGTLVTAAVTLYLGTASPDHIQAMLEVSRHFAEKAGIDALLLGIPAGFYIAAIVWMLPSSKGFEIFVIVLFTYLIAAGGFTHVVAGATEVFLLVINGELAVLPAVLTLIVPTFTGNVIGGSLLFALLAYAQVHEEM